MSAYNARAGGFNPSLLRPFKKEIRIVGVAFASRRPVGKESPLVGAVYRGGLWLEGVLKGAFEVGGTDAAERIAEMIVRSRHYPQLRLVMLSSITMPGYNMVNLVKLNRLVMLPVMSVERNKLDKEALIKSLRTLKDFEVRSEAIKALGEPLAYRPGPRFKTLYVYSEGLGEGQAIAAMDIACKGRPYPEPLRAASIIARALSAFY